MTFNKILLSEQKKYLKTMDTELILVVLKAINILVEKSLIHSSKDAEKKKLLNVLPVLTDIL